MQRLFIYTLLILSAVSNAVSAQEKSILLLNGFLHKGNGEVIASAHIGIRNGKITELKNSLASTYKKEEWDTIVDLMGKHVYPSFIAPNSTLGLTEIDAVRASRDFAEVGVYNPHVRAQIAYNVESKVISTVRTNGVLIAQASPRSGDITGSSSVMFLDGWNWEDATLLKDDGIHVNWPSSLQGGGWWAEPAPKTRNEKYDEQKKALFDFFTLAKAYADAGKKPERDIRLEAMTDCFNGTKRVYFRANDIQELLDVIDFAKHFGLKYPVIVGGYDSHLIGKRLKDSGIPIMLGRTHALPQHEDDPIDLPYRLPSILKELGIKFCLQNEGDMEAMNARNLPFQAGTAMAYGLSEEEAIRAITLDAAEIMGFSKEYGSIEIGKSATLFVSEGNALDMRSNNVTLALIRGKLMPLTNFQQELYQRYSEKYKN